MKIPFTRKRLRKLPAVLLGVAAAVQLPGVVALLGGAGAALKLSGALTLVAAVVKPLIGDQRSSEPASADFTDTPL